MTERIGTYYDLFKQKENNYDNSSLSEKTHKLESKADKNNKIANLWGVHSP